MVDIEKKLQKLIKVDGDTGLHGAKSCQIGRIRSSKMSDKLREKKGKRLHLASEKKERRSKNRLL